ncbi:hypothetical protein [Paracoccus methylarcula]|uniref:Uncharacterized protein n=1 Tax=Paracoccus methylarcula TaxID=72022 RepID=A0A3R7SDC8_9RHOB|nr:hypothetical protein [Paracoccus methylarcula]RNF35472.1 hypothetical protein A7A09_003285 [Paracoccus methylarcula]
MRHFLAALLLSTAPAMADDTTTSALIAEKGLSAAGAELEASPASPDRDMALAAVRFLSGIEAAYQARWRIGATEPLIPAPILGTSLPGNPAPEPMRADFLNGLAADLSASMQSTREILRDDEAALVLRLPDLWLDVDADGQRGPSEGLLDLTLMPLPEGVDGEIRFDTADAEWLRAYTHLIEVATALILAFDPEPALAGKIELDETLREQFATMPDDPQPDPAFDSEARYFGPVIDRVAVVIQTLRHQPDKDRIAEAVEHAHAMIDANRSFWAMIAAETDDDREWIPGDNQKAALGFDIPKGAGRTWLAVLEDAEQVLDGERLIPYWRFAPGHGIDLKHWLDDPQPVDLVGWTQGSAALPHARMGKTVSRDAWRDFTGIFGGRAGLYMVLFN